MNASKVLLLPIATLLLLSACGDDGATDAQPGVDSGSDAGADVSSDVGDGSGAVTYYEHVKPLVDAHCVPCHRAGGPAPFDLTAPEQVISYAPSIAAATASRAMPPFSAAPAVRPYLYDISLSDEQIATIGEWVDAGAMLGDAANEGSALDVDFGLLEDPNLTLEMGADFSPTIEPDHYRCFVLPWPYEEDKYVTGFNVRAGNVPIVHHAVLYLVDAQFADIVDDADGSDGSPGYACYGSASPAGSDSFATRQFGGWAPGSQGTTYADGTGVKVSAGARVVLQMHYNTVGLPAGQADRSVVEFRVEEDVERDGGNLPWLNWNWPESDGAMSIPAGEASVIHSYEDDPTTAVLASLFIPGVDVSEGLRIFSVYPHMHQLGRRIEASLRRTDGTIVPLARIDNWDFHWQREYILAEPVDVLPGDMLRVECEFDNSAANQPIVNGEQVEPRDMDFGEGSYDEMCVAAFYVSALNEPGTGSACDEFDSVEADEGVFELSFDAAASVRGAPNLEGELRGPIYGSVFRAEDVTILGPNEGAEAVASFTFDDVDLREGPSGPFTVDTTLPAGQYQFLGFMDTDGNADPESPDPDLNDPVLIPGRAARLVCATQPVTARFALLLPDR